jgi:hypothetical protein
MGLLRLTLQLQQPSFLAGILMTIHQLAPENDKLVELQPQSAAAVTTALTAADRARQLRIEPLFSATAAAAGQTLGSFGSSSSSRAGVGSSSSSSSAAATSSQAAAAAGFREMHQTPAAAAAAVVAAPACTT